jgi:hypothetical protein
MKFSGNKLFSLWLCLTMLLAMVIAGDNDPDLDNAHLLQDTVSRSDDSALLPTLCFPFIS